NSRANRSIAWNSTDTTKPKPRSTRSAVPSPSRMASARRGEIESAILEFPVSAGAGGYDRATQFTPPGRRTIMSRYIFAACLVVGCNSIFPLTARAQQFGAADALYSSGVEAYFRGCSAEAESSFSSLMSVDPNDPRAHYFRALSLMRQGREDEARSDMEIGAQLEARSPYRFDIGKTLE